jgi:hypothetical protein
LCERQGRNHGIKEFLSVLLLHLEYSDEDLKAAVELALEVGVISCEGVKHLLCHTGPEKRIEPLQEWPSLSAPDVSVYTQLYMEPEAEVGFSVASNTESEFDEDDRVALATGGDTL